MKRGPLMQARFFHGGAPDLSPGDLLTPREPGDQRHLVDNCPVCEARRRGAPSAYDVNHNFDRVYITTVRAVARGFAAGYPKGALYSVEPVGDIEPDPEQPPGYDEPVNFAVHAARVLSVLDPLVALSPKEERRLLRDIETSPLRAALMKARR
jgi:hypothetical protein